MANEFTHLWKLASQWSISIFKNHTQKNKDKNNKLHIPPSPDFFPFVTAINIFFKNHRTLAQNNLTGTWIKHLKNWIWDLLLMQAGRKPELKSKSSDDWIGHHHYCCVSVQIDDLHQSNQNIHILIKALHKLNSNKDMKTKIILVALNLYSQHLRIFGSFKILQKWRYHCPAEDKFEILQQIV